MRRTTTALLACAFVLLASGTASPADEKKGELPKDGPGDPALTFDVVAKDPAKYVGKRVTWPALATTGSGKEVAVASNPDVKDARKYKLYAVRFASEKEMTDLFFADRVTLTGTVVGTLEISYEVTGPGGQGKEKRKEKVPLLEYPSYEKAKK